MSNHGPLHQPAMSDYVIGILEDDKVHSTLIEAILLRAGLASLSFDSVSDFRRRNGIHSVDLILLDWNLPDESGLTFLQTLRDDEHITVPVIFITANDRENQTVQALTAGADDYVVKPVRAGELVARIGSVLRRTQSASGTEELHQPFHFLPEQRIVKLFGHKLDATPKEFDLMLFMFRRAGRIISREAMLTHVWRTRSDVATRSIDTYVSRLRRKFGLDGASGWVIEGIYQQGYRLQRLTGEPGKPLGPGPQPPVQ